MAPFTKPLGPRDAGLAMSLDEFEDANYEAGFRYELIHGLLVATPPPLEEERDANEELGYMLREYQKRHPRGKVLDLTLPNTTSVPKNRIGVPIAQSGLVSDAGRARVAT
jgi:Uma2 family endonuclease